MGVQVMLSSFVSRPLTEAPNMKQNMGGAGTPHLQEISKCCTRRQCWASTGKQQLNVCRALLSRHDSLRNRR